MDDRVCKESCEGTCESHNEATFAPAGNELYGNKVSIKPDADAKMTAKSRNRPFDEVLASRRAVLTGGLGLMATTFFDASTPAAAHGWKWGWGWHHKPKPLIGFTPVAVADGTGPVPSISADYQYQVLIPWGDPLQPGGPSYAGDPNTRPTSADQAQMIGIGHDGMWFFPKEYSFWRHGHFGHYCKSRGSKRNDRGVLCINHEFGGNSHVLGKSAPQSLEDVRLSQHAHGVSVVEIAEHHGKWQQVRSKLSRRIHVNTDVEFSGPVAGHALLQNPAGNTPKGTVNNCANGYTPWGTYLTCEENFDGYFGVKNSANYTRSETDAAYSLGPDTGYRWYEFDDRFDLSNPDYVNERNRFGWVVEIDPTNPRQKPVKRTALGRFKHEGVAVTEGKGGKIVCYMGDDTGGEFIYKFVSADNWKKMLRRGKSPLDEGKLYVAKFNEDGSGKWLELTIENPDLAARFADQAEVLTYARIAGDIVGATPMNRPEWATVAPNGDVYCTLTNNSGNTAGSVANPAQAAADGHIIKWHDTHEHTGTDFTWEIFIIAANTHGTEDTFSDPDGLWADPDGRLFIETDGGQKDGLNNQMLVANTKTGEIRRLFTGVTGDEITGITVTPDRRTMFVNIQHAGNGDPAATNFPAEQGSGMIPRDCTIVITKKDGGIIGS